MAYTTINNGASYFNTLLYTGNGSTLTVTGNSFQPDFTWIKERSAAGNHKLADVVRGTTKYLSSNLTDAEDSTGSGIQSWNSTGFSLSNATDINDSGQTYAAWNWLAANSTTTNTSGSISSTVSVNTTSRFSIVSYTGTGSLGTVGHGLGVAPNIIIVKSRSGAGQPWHIYTSMLGNTKALFFDTSSAGTASSWWNDTSPTSSVFTVNTSGGVNGNGATLIAYCFAEVKGYSKFGSYVGNGSTNGPFIYTGFKPAFVMTKASSTTGNWKISWDSFSNGDDYNLAPNLSSAEGNANQIDLLSNGFKCRASDTDRNGSGTTYIYAAFAENPFVLTDGTPVTAR